MFSPRDIDFVERLVAFCVATVDSGDDGADILLSMREDGPGTGFDMVGAWIEGVPIKLSPELIEDVRTIGMDINEEYALGILDAQVELGVIPTALED